MALAVTVTHADGTTTRWGPDEFEAARVPGSLGFSTSIPGGFKDATIRLARRIDIDYSDLNLLDDVTIYGPGGEVAFEGRIAQLPRSHGDDTSITVGCVGHAAHLEDDKSFTEIYVDRDLGRWEAAGTQRRQNTTLTYGQTDSSVTGGNTETGGIPALAQEFTGHWAAAPGLPLVEGWYDAGPGNAIGKLYYAWKRNANVDNTNTNWAWAAGLSTDDVLSSADTTGSLRAAGPSTGTLTATAAAKRYAVVQHYFNTAAGGGEGTIYGIYWTVLAVYGDHGLTTVGTSSATEAPGVYAHDVVANAVGRAAPLLNFTTGGGGSIQDTGFIIPQLEFKDPTTANDVVQKANAYHLYDYGVYDNRGFFFRQPDPERLTWEARLSEGAHLDLEGDQAEDVFNGVVVKFNEAGAGTQKMVGPPGSGFDATDSTLEDTSESNPVNAHGIPKRWALLDISFPTTTAGAIQLGAVWLAEKSLPQRKGQIVLRGDVLHPTKGLRPAWSVRAGDFIRVSDHPADIPRRIVETSFAHDTGTLTASIGGTPNKLDAILERIGIVSQAL